MLHLLIKELNIFDKNLCSTTSLHLEWILKHSSVFSCTDFAFTFLISKLEGKKIFSHVS